MQRLISAGAASFLLLTGLVGGAARAADVKVHVTGTVTLVGTSAPLAGAEVGFSPTGSSSWSHDATALSDAAGHYVIDLPAGTYNVYVSGKGLAEGWWTGTTLVADVPHALVVPVVAGQPLTVDVSDHKPFKLKVKKKLTHTSTAARVGKPLKFTWPTFKQKGVDIRAWWTLVDSKGRSTFPRGTWTPEGTHEVSKKKAQTYTPTKRDRGKHLYLWVGGDKWGYGGWSAGSTTSKKMKGYIDFGVVH